MTRLLRARRLSLALTVAVAGILVTVATALAWSADLRHGSQRRFDRRTDESAHRLAAEIERAADPLLGARALFGGRATVTQPEFGRYVAALQLAERYPGVRVVGFTVAVPATATTPEQRPVRFAEPGFAAAVGVDTVRHPSLRAAQDLARDTGRPASAPAFELSPLVGGGTGFAVVVPVYRSGTTPATVAARRADIAGWVGATVHGGAFVAGELGGEHEPVRIELFAGTTRPAYVGGHGTGRPGDPGLTAVRTFVVHGVPWTVRTRALAGFTAPADRAGPAVLLAGGLLLTGLAVALLDLLVVRRRRAEDLADLRGDDLTASEARFRTLVQSSPAGVFFTDGEGRRYANPRLREILGLAQDDPLPDERSVVHPDDVETVLRSWPRQLLDRGEARSRLRVLRPDGAVRRLDVVAAPVAGPAETAWVGSATDVTDVVESQQLAERLSRAFEATTDLVAIASGDGTLLWANAALREFAGVPGGLPAGRRADEVVPPTWQHRFASEVIPALVEHGYWSGEFALRGATGRDLPVSLVVVAQHDATGAVEYYAATARDLTERKELERRLAHEVMHDRVTGVANRALFGDRTERALARAQQSGDRVAVLSLDVDRFKVVNDSLGHDAGDALLVAVARRIEAALLPGETIARSGGDEFAVLCEGIRDQQDAVAAADRIQAVFSRPYFVAGSRVQATVSIGVAVSNTDHRGDDLLRDAVAAMYRAKECGGARHEVFEQALRARAARRLDMETALHGAIETGGVEVHYQPEVRLRDGRVVAVEALARWRHPGQGQVSPAEFVPMAEQSGLIDALGELVLRQACRDAVRWRAVPGRAPEFAVWVNVSPVQLARAGFVERVEQILAETGADPASIGLEITETALLADADAALVTLTRLRALGVGLSLDDFGTGYSSLSHLKRLPIDAVKVDRSFVAGLGRGGDDEAIVAAVVAMARALGIVPFAEGVENAEQAARLLALGCEVAQGYLYSRPVPANRIDALLGGCRPVVPAPRGAADDAAPVSPLRAGGG